MMISNDLVENCNERLRTEGKIDPSLYLNQNNPWQRLECYINLPILDREKTVKERQGELIVPDFWDQIYPKKVPLVICATIGQKSGRFLMAFHCIKFLFWHFDIKLASADFFINELSDRNISRISDLLYKNLGLPTSGDADILLTHAGK